MSEGTLLGLMAQTPIHAGAGSSMGVIDLPVQREVHTDWPCIYGSSMKGALRDKAESQSSLTKEDVTELFGPDTENASDHAGALNIMDAQIVLLPVRSLQSSYRWVTCPAVLQRLWQRAAMLGFDWAALSLPAFVNESDEAYVNEPSKHGHKLFLEEFSYTEKALDKNTSEALKERLLSLSAHPQFLDQLETRLTLVSDDHFRHLCRHATAIAAHNVLNDLTKASENLWYEETLSPDTFMVSSISTQGTRKEGSSRSASDILQLTVNKLFDQPFLRVGGNETVGMGWFHVTCENNLLVKGDEG